jgi:hypothetical protein
MQSTIKLYITILLIFSIFACDNDKESKLMDKCVDVKKLNGERKNLNVSIFLDLSDRISPTFNPNRAMEYKDRDLGYITSIAEAFEIHLRNKRTVLMKDNIKLFLHPLPEGITEIDQILSTLDKNLTRDNATLENICSVSADYENYSNLIYDETLSQKETFAKQNIDNYPGSDIYDFFKSKVKDYCIKENHRNILFIITDGYMYMSGTKDKNSNNKSNYILSKELEKWGFNSKNYHSKITNEGYAFQVPTSGLNDLEVFVVGFAPKKSWELDILNTYWSSWLKEMGVKNFQDENWRKYLKKADLPSELQILFQEFIYN